MMGNENTHDILYVLQQVQNDEITRIGVLGFYHFISFVLSFYSLSHSVRVRLFWAHSTMEKNISLCWMCLESVVYVSVWMCSVYVHICDCSVYLQLNALSFIGICLYVFPQNTQNLCNHFTSYPAFVSLWNGLSIHKM